MLKIAKTNNKPEVYQAIQGEGMTTGKPCLFVRTSTCNLHCRWCDTFYTWNFKGTKFNVEHDTAPKVNIIDEQIEVSEEKLIKIINKTAGNIRRVVFSGGEPTIQQKQLEVVMRTLKEQDPVWKFEMETNGTMKLLPEVYFQLNQINCSPKLESSGNQEKLRNRPEAIQQYKSLYLDELMALQFKFVVGPKTFNKDLKEIQSWQKEHNIPSDIIYLMPQGITEKVIKEGSLKLAKTCQKYNYNLSTRLHILLYGSKRAV
tara:strand:+ start:204 stop:980 length:777 start_codon:yes stop_codon:yes gene_type:complete